MGESPNEEHYKVQEQGTYGDAKEVFDKGSVIFVETLQYTIVHHSVDDGEVEW